MFQGQLQDTGLMMPTPSTRSPRLSAAALVRRLVVDPRPDDSAGIAYRELAAQIRQAALGGRIASGSGLPSERELAAALQVSRTTVAAGYAVLREQGWLHSRQGAPSRLIVPGVPVGASPAFGMEYAQSLIASTTTAAGGAPIDLGVASLPAPEDHLRRAAAAALADLDGYLAADGYHPYGLPQLRERIAQQYTDEGVPTSPDQILVTSGAQHGLSLALQELTLPGDRVLVEGPTYPTALDAVRAGHRIPATLPLVVGDEHPWDLELLAAILRSSAPRLAYLIPDLQNPTGAVMTEQDRSEIVDLLGRAGCPVVVDESFRSLVGPGFPSSMAGFGAADRVLAIGSVSKPFWGGLRVGWVRTAPGIVDRLAAARALTDMAGPVLEQLVATHLLEDPAGAVAVQNARLDRSRAAAVAALSEHLPHWSVARPVGGVTLWITLPGPYAGELARRALQVGVRIVPGTRFGADGTMENHLRIPVTAPAELLVEAVRRLALVDHEASVGHRSPASGDRIV